jgi:hypothetical protein
VFGLLVFSWVTFSFLPSDAVRGIALALVGRPRPAAEELPRPTAEELPRPTAVELPPPTAVEPPRPAAEELPRPPEELPRPTAVEPLCPVPTEQRKLCHKYMVINLSIIYSKYRFVIREPDKKTYSG